MKIAIIIFQILLGCFVFAQHPNVFKEQVIQGQAQGTTYLIRCFSNQLILKKDIDSILNSIDLSLSIYNPNSLISTFNKTDTRAIQMDPHMATVVRKSVEIHKVTNGYFDITVLPLIKLWGFGPDGFKQNPTTEAISSILPLVGMRNLKIKAKKIMKNNPGVSIDLNGIAQGYSVDVLARYLEDNDVQHYLIELGGEIKVKGAKDSGQWQIAIQRPPSRASAPSDSLTYILNLKDKAVTTSGTYENKRMVSNRYVSHHINPLTGYPIENVTVSATVIANTTMEADALDNYFVYLNPQQAVEFADKLKGIEVYLIYFENNSFKEAFSKGFKNYIYN
ncbi:FAD:protein FMN transferase [Sphingobacterium olei]|uniref:FAD:protein FMN transferase n=1 Tax=Sphingobacterium olei TaxID=2571155 RepID=A0A4U0NHT3_9SPHI|nr:FAD:protein FMN transferase [Sphingobacterium olei]TJZ53242.1 FAD:protein FMN transferase [Sphingobacterium olei]